MTRIQVNPMHTSYGAFGHRTGRMSNAATAFAGEVMESGGSCYLLGTRLYSPILRRFLGPDSLSPFDRGGVNRYAYCSGDPINRVDPGGHAWWEWVATGVGLVAAVVGTVATAGALAGVVGAAAAGSLTAAISTPSMASLVTAAVLDVVAVTAEIGSIASKIAGADDAASIMGWVAIGSGAGATGASLLSKAAGRLGGSIGRARPRSGSSSSRRALFPIDDVTATVQDVSADARRRAIYRDPQVRWYRTTLGDSARSFHWVVNAPIGRRHLYEPLSRIAGEPIDANRNAVHLYGGAEGIATGENWGPGGHRLLGNRDLVGLGRERLPELESLLPGRVIEPVNIGGMTQEAMLRHMSKDGHHIHAFCFSAFDELLADMLRLDDIQAPL